MSKGQLVFRYEISDLFFMHFIPPEAAVTVHYTGGARAQQINKMVCRVYSLAAQGSREILRYTRAAVFIVHLNSQLSGGGHH